MEEGSGRTGGGLRRWYAMNSYLRYAGGAPVGSIVVRIVRSGDALRATVSEVERQTELGDVNPSEEMPVDVALRLAESRRQNRPGASVYVRLESGVEWRDEWGRIETASPRARE